MNRTVRIVIELISLSIVIVVCWRMISEPVVMDTATLCPLYNTPAKKFNILLLGHHANSKGPVAIVIKPPIDLKEKSAAEIMTVRREQITQYRDICVAEDYKPRASIFSGIRDKKPWWGLVGQYYYENHWPGEKNIEGLSEESRFVLNPLLLVGITDIEAVTDVDLGEDWDIQRDKGNGPPPADYGPHQLIWWPAQSRAETRYDAGARLRQFIQEEYVHPVSESRHILFYLTAYNAQDFGFRWAYISLGNSQNIWNPSHSQEPFPLREFIHVGGSCGYPGGCNNASPHVPELCCFRAEHLPAKVQIHLWKEKPASPSAKPDMVFDIWVE